MAVNVCRAMLKTTRVRQAFRELAIQYRKEQPQARSLRDSGLPVDAAIFLVSIQEDFPRIFVDDSITSPLIQGYHKRLLWDVKFRPSDQYICLNGEVIENRAPIERHVPKHANTTLEIQK